MNKKNIPNSINNLLILETEFDAISIFKYKQTSSWINIKNYLYSLTLNGVVSNNFSKRDIISKNGLILILMSIKNYLLNIVNKKERVLYIGAGSGLFYYKDEILDSYFPLDCSDKDIIYMLSADHAKKLMHYYPFINTKKVIIYSYLIGPLKIFLTKIFKIFVKIKIEDNFIKFLNNNKMITSKKELHNIHANFLITTILYKIFFFPLNIKKAYIVSAYSNTEICSVLRDRGIEIIELQHGIIGNVHRGYNYVTNNLLLPTPNKVNVYNEFWKNELIYAGYFTEENINITGRLKYQLIDKNISIFDNNFIVFTGQGGFYNDIEKLFIDSANYLLLNKIQLIYIPHPNEMIGESLNLLKKVANNFKNIIIIEHKIFTTEQYIYNSIAHVSVYSSCHFDSVHYKNKTYVFDVMDDNPMDYYSNQFKEIFINIKTLEEIKFDK